MTEKDLAEDYIMVLHEAKSMGCSKIKALYNIPLKNMEMIVQALEEVQQYRAIGTLEECRAAVEKQKAKKIVRVKLRQSEWGSEYRCPVCESDLIKTVFFNEDGTEPDEKISWCSGCGTKLDWGDEE